MGGMAIEDGGVTVRDLTGVVEDNDLSVEYEDNREVYIVHKGLLGSGRCFQQIEVEIKFSSTRAVIEEHAQGGTIVE